MPSEQLCRFCRQTIHGHAKKCPYCGEWAVETTIGPVASVLRVIGWIWAGLSVIGAIVLWRDISTTREALSDSGGLIGAFGYGLVIALVLQGVAIGVGMLVFAERAPRQPLDN